MTRIKIKSSLSFVLFRCKYCSGFHLNKDCEHAQSKTFPSKWLISKIIVDKSNPHKLSAEVIRSSRCNNVIQKNWR